MGWRPLLFDILLFFHAYSFIYLHILGGAAHERLGEF